MNDLHKKSFDVLDACIAHSRSILSYFESEETNRPEEDLPELFKQRSEHINELYQLTHSPEWQQLPNDENFSLIQQRFRLLQDLDQLLRSQLETRYNEVRAQYKQAQDQTQADSKYRTAGRHKSSLFIESPLKG